MYLRILSQFLSTPILLLFIVCSHSCSYSDTPNLVSTKAKYLDISYTLQLPDYLSEEALHRLNPTAALQYCNYFRNLYITVNDTLIPSNAFNDYIDAQVNSLSQRLDRPQQVSRQALVINGYNAVQVEMTGDVGKGEIIERMYYRLTFIDSPNLRYQISMWTWDKWREKYHNILSNISGSFIEQ